MDIIHESEWYSMRISGRQNTMHTFYKPFNTINNTLITLLMWLFYQYYY